jgi:hypothetical protein
LIHPLAIQSKSIKSIYFDTPNPNPVGYGFGYLLFIPVKNWNGFGETRTLQVWEMQNPSPTRLIAMPTCHRTGKNRKAKTEWLAKSFIHTLRHTLEMGTKGLIVERKEK